MIARHENQRDTIDIWAALAAPLPAGVISWRQDGRTISRDGRYVARFVAYVEANTVRERLDSVVPGEWDLTLELLPVVTVLDEDATHGACSFKARLQILGVIREDVGTGKDYKQAATDAFKRAAVRFGVAHELYAYEQNWVPMDGDGKFARPMEDPAAAFARRHGRSKPALVADASPPFPAEDAGASDSGGEVSTSSEPSCPKCGGRVWDNRVTKRNPKAPDYKCRDRSCDGVIWPARSEAPSFPHSESADRAEPLVRATEQREEIPF